VTSTIKYPRVVDQKKTKTRPAQPRPSVEDLTLEGLILSWAVYPKGLALGKNGNIWEKKTLEKTRCIMLKD